MANIISDEAKSQLRRLMELRQKRDEDAVAAKQSEQEYRDAEADAYESLRDLKGALKVDLGEPWGTVAFHTRETHFARIIDDSAVLEYFENRAMMDDVTVPKFRMRVLNEIVRDSREQGTELPPGIDSVARRGVTITRQKD